jgi:adenosine kinase
MSQLDEIQLHFTPGMVLGIGNPLLDATMIVDEAYLAKYKLKLGSATMESDEHKEIFMDVQKRTDVAFGAGGCALNTIRAVNWMSQLNNDLCCYVGTVGNDKGAKQLTKVLNNEGVKEHFVTHSNLATGTCAVLVVGKERTLVTSLAAAGVFTDDDFMRQEIYQSMLAARVYFTTGFFFNVLPKTLIDLGLCSLTPGKRFLFNLAAPFVIELYWERILETMPYVDVVFCNNIEAETCGKVAMWGCDIDVVTEKLASLPLAEGKQPRIAIVTCGPDDTVVCYKEKVYHIAPIPVPHDLLVDTNGAGDSFAGGFIAEYLKYALLGREITEDELFRCVDSAHYCARKVIGVVGCRFPGKPSFAAKNFSATEKALAITKDLRMEKEIEHIISTSDLPVNTVC